MALVTLFVLATGGALSPLTFLFAVPVVLAAALLGTGGGLAAALGAGAIFGALIARAALADLAGDLSLGRLLYAGTSHLVGFLALGLLGGALADRLRRADTELAQQRDAVAELRALHADIVESISAGLMTTDREGRITFLNPAGSRIAKMELTAVAGRPAAEILGLAPRFLDEAGEMLRAGQRVRLERAWRRPADGEELYLGYTVSQLKGHTGEAAGWLIVFQDLTGLLALEQEVRIRERMAALGEMAAGMAHELRNPWPRSRGCVQVIGRGQVGEEQRPLVDVAIQETERLNRIIRDFLQYARPGPFQAAPVELVGLLEEMARLFRKSPDMSSRHRVVVTRGPGNTWALADRDRMRQVFWNLAGNAIKAMPDGGSLAVRVSGEGGDRVDAVVRGRGARDGLRRAAALLPAVRGDVPRGLGAGRGDRLPDRRGARRTGPRHFAPRARYGSPTGPPGGGAAGGRAGGTGRRSPAAGGPRAGRGRLRELTWPWSSWSTTNPASARCCAPCCAPKGHLVCTAASGEEGLGVLSREAVDLLITDLSMPGMDGVELLRRASTVSPETPGRS